MKTCGRCNFCCKVMGIEELSKAPGEWCRHAKPGRGCAIHGEHPASCQAFACQWLAQPDMPDAYKPDLTKVVMTVENDPQPRLIANCEPANPVAWRNEPIYSLLKGRAQATWNSSALVVARAGLRMWLIAPAEDIDLGEVVPGSPLVIEQAASGAIKVTILPAVA